MPADFTIVEGDDTPVLADTLKLSDSKPAPLEGATLAFTMRGLGTQPLRLAGVPVITDVESGGVSFTFAPGDTIGRRGMYVASWDVTYASGQKQTFPTVGYLTIEIQPALGAAAAGGLVGLPEDLDRLSIPPSDRIHDAKLAEWIEALAPLVENHTGPIIPKVYDEWYGGGHTTISLRHKPSYGYGTKPVLTLMAASEYRGPIEYNLAIIANPTQGSIYSCQLNAELGEVVRRTAGGGVMPFWRDPEHGDQSVHIVYGAGQEGTPANVKMAAIETLKWWWDATQSMGRGAMTLADTGGARPMVALPYHVEAMLAPTHRYPALA